MSRFIKNYEALAKSKERIDALAIIEAAYEAIDTEAAIRQHVRVENEKLFIKGQSFELSSYENIYIVGLGKVSGKAAAVLEDIFNHIVTAGAVIGIKEMTCQVVDTYAGSHPLPSAVNFKATQHLEQISQDATENDLVVVVVSGGGSALLCSSEQECGQGARLYKEFLKSGGTIDELNTVRQHISHLKGGGLAKVLYPAEVVSLIFSDVPDGDPSVVASGPTYLDETTIEDARTIIDKYNLGEYDLVETPKDEKYFEKIHNILLVSNDNAVTAMAEKAQSLGYEAVTIEPDLYDYAPGVVEKMKSAAHAGSVVIAAGETRVVIDKDSHGKGGRNSAVTLESLKHLDDNQLFISFASDGRDNTEAAGAIADKVTKDSGLNIDEYLSHADSFTYFEQTEGLIMTGPVEANVSDLMLLLTSKGAD